MICDWKTQITAAVAAAAATTTYNNENNIYLNMYVHPFSSHVNCFISIVSFDIY